MLAVDGYRRTIRSSIRAALGLSPLVLALGVHAQQAAPVETREGLEEVVVTGFRQSLNVALDEKRAAAGAIDAIVAEDIADFPDLNLSESIQRIPGVAISRDAGEGRQITVRGLGGSFTRTLINGVEALATSSGSDALPTGTNRTGAFDFNIFASDLFSGITVEKSTSAQFEEGSLGATIDLRTAHPFDYSGFTLVGSAKADYNDLAHSASPALTALISDTYWGGTLGVLLSAAYS